MRTWSPGFARTCQRTARVLSLLVFVWVIPGQQAAHAGEYPRSALSTSLGMAPELVDETSLLFRLPQRVGLAHSRLFVLANTSYSTFSPFSIYIGDVFPTSNTVTLGAVGHTHGNSFFLFAQPSAFIRNEILLQAGWGAAWSVWRAGVAIRGGHVEWEQSRYSDYFDGRTYGSESSARRSIWEGSVGVGVGQEGTVFDLVLDARRPDESFQGMAVDRDTTAAQLESKDDTSYEVAGRLRFPLGSSAELVAVGSWGLMEGEIESSSLLGDSLVQGVDPRRLESWSGGLAFSFATQQIDWLALSAYWRRDEIPYNTSGSGFSTSIAEQIALSLALRQQLWRELQARLGVNVRHEKVGTETYERSSYAVSTQMRQQENFRAGFSWGVSYSWRRFDARAALEETLDLDRLFVALDVLVRL